MRRVESIPAALAAWPLLLAIDALRHPLEAHMAVHMLVLPLVAVAGAILAVRWPANAPGRWWAVVDAQGLTGLTTASCVGVIWMLPVALDLSLLWPAFSIAKYASLWLAGWLLGASGRRISTEAAAFFAGNAVLMLATAGLLYLEATSRLCLSYRLDDQPWAGAVLLALAAALGLGALVRMARADPPHGDHDGPVPPRPATVAAPARTKRFP